MISLSLSIKSIMIAINEFRSRYSSLRQQFYQRYNRNPDFYVRSPGRVNLIGEHIDYSLFSVLPMAIDRDVIVRFKNIKSRCLLLQLKVILPVLQSQM